MCAVFQGLGGLLASIASVITIWLGSSPVQTGFAYFLIALVVMLSSLLTFFVLIRLVSLRLLLVLVSSLYCATVHGRIEALC